MSKQLKAHNAQKEDLKKKSKAINKYIKRIIDREKSTTVSSNDKNSNNNNNNCHK